MNFSSTTASYCSFSHPLSYFFSKFPLSLKVAGKTSKGDGSIILSLVKKKDEDSFIAYAIMAANETVSLVPIVIVSLAIEAAG